VEREFEPKQVEKEEISSKGTLDERVPDCWYDGNTSGSEGDSMEVSQSRLAKVNPTGSTKRKRPANSSGKRRSITLKMPTEEESSPVKDETDQQHQPMEIDAV
jgi:hypothetical protein